MRKFAVTVVAPESDRLSAIVRGAVEVCPTLSVGPALQSLNAGRPVVEIETDCDEAIDLLKRLIHFCERLQELGFVYRVELSERSPAPMSGAPPQIISKTVPLSHLLETLRFEEEFPIELTRPTLDFADCLKDATFFCGLGQAVGVENVSVAKSLKDAIKGCRSRRWENVTLEAQNLLTMALYYGPARRHYGGKWNKFVQLLRPIVETVVDRQRLFAETLGFSDDVWNQVRWILLGGLMEQQYAKYVAPRFGTEWCQWFMKGRLPCGWEGRFPDEGKLVIF